MFEITINHTSNLSNFIPPTTQMYETFGCMALAILVYHRSELERVALACMWVTGVGLLTGKTISFLINRYIWVNTDDKHQQQLNDQRFQSCFTQHSHPSNHTTDSSTIALWKSEIQSEWETWNNYDPFDTRLSKATIGFMRKQQVIQKNLSC
jgi:hypothetical protein